MSLAPAIPKVCAVDARVLAVRRICREHVAIECTLANFPPSNPGQFLQLLCADPSDPPPRRLDWQDGELPQLTQPEWFEHQAFLRRPFSIADRWEDSGGVTHLVIISRAIGSGTRWLDRLQPDTALNLSGPFGHGFDLPADRETPIVLVGGGVGIPPLLYMARRLYESDRPKVIGIFGATSSDLLPIPLSAEPAADGDPRICLQLPGGASFPCCVTTDDGSLGLRGVVTTALERWVAKSGTGEAAVLTCGPDGMLRTVARLTRKLGISCQLCIERTMGCGMGTCLSCVAAVCDAGRPAGWRWALSCSEGPVFDRDALLDYAAE